MIILCPLSYEADYVMRVIGLCEEMGIPCIIVNPQLINGDQGFGLRARSMRNTLINPFTMYYKLKTLEKGALVREFPAGFSVWMDDLSCPEGFRLLETYLNEPPNEAVNELFDVREISCT